jgi:hypothetical protein
MLNLEVIKEKYQEMLTDDLVRLSKKPKDLREDVIPILKLELIRRGKRDAADALTNFKDDDSELKYKNMSLSELRQMVEERVNSGEAMDSIKIDLRLNGIDVFEVLKEEIQFQEEVFDSITKLKEIGVSQDTIDKHLKESYNIEKSEASKIKTDLKIKGKRNQTWGFVFIIVSCLSFLLIMLTDNYYKILKFSITLLITGISMYAIGVKQAKD